ncbi:MAG TPA: 2,3,4,5-tetrahydropyridine-2,6-dicarboxylate N-acetyltransferase [Haloplasmataceae bacterium]
MNETFDIVKYIKEAKKVTPVKAYIKGYIKPNNELPIKLFGNNDFYIAIGDFEEVKKLIEDNKDTISDYEIENNCRNSAIPLLDLKNIKARIEPGAIIRDKVIIGEDAVIMMGAVINIGAEIGSKTMIDMNAVIGARGKIGNNCHIGAGAVIAGVLEPPSSTPVIIEDDCLIGANAVILEGVKVGKGAVVAAGSVVIDDVKENTVVGGVPARFIKMKDENTLAKTKIIDDLRS